MDTARVDIRKLQQLNDRINQCLDALNQVRASVHGLSHTGAPMGGAMPPSAQFGGIGGVGTGGAGTPFGGTGLGGDTRFAYGSPAFGGVGGPMGGFGGGLSHTPYSQGLGIFGQGSQFPGFQQNPSWGIGGGLSHSPFEAEALYNRPVWLDPVLASKVRETLPYLAYSLPPVISVF